MNTQFEDVRCEGSPEEISHKSQILGDQEVEGKQGMVYETLKKENDSRRRCQASWEEMKGGFFILNENITGTLK